MSAVTRSPDGTLTLDGADAPVDWLLEMNRFDAAMLLDGLAANGALETGLMRQPGTEITNRTIVR